MNNKRIRIIIADDHAIYREGIRTVLAGREDMEIIAEAATGERLIELCREFGPDVVLSDIMMPDMTGDEAAKRILQERPQTAIIALTMLEKGDMILKMVEAGAMGYMFKTAGRDQIIEGLTAVAAGNPYFCDNASHLFGQILLNSQAKEPSIIFSAREKEIILLMCKQLTSQEIAEQLFLSKKTVDGHRYNIMEKIGCKNAIGIVLYAIRTGMFKL